MFKCFPFYCAGINALRFKIFKDSQKLKKNHFDKWMKKK